MQIQSLAYDFPVYEPSPRPDPAEIPGWVEQPKLWRAALAVLQHPPPRQRWGFTHAGFQPFNLLWSRHKLTGIVDWAYPCVTCALPPTSRPTFRLFAMSVASSSTGDCSV